MQGYNLILVYNTGCYKILMCKRNKPPYEGLLNLVGGKVEIGENGLSAAYRELFEETSITADDIKLFHLMDFTYYCYNCYVEVYVGKLKQDIPVYGDENELLWVDADSDVFDKEVFAGSGNIGHIVEETRKCAAEILLINF